MLTKPDQTVRPSALMLMASGRTVDLCNLTAADVHFPDLVEALVKIPRFNGATAHLTYTVAQHACLAHDHADDAFKPAALLENFHKAYIGEVNRSAAFYLAVISGDTADFQETLAVAKSDLLAPILEAAGVADPADSDSFAAQRSYLKALGLKLLATERRDLMAVRPDTPDWKLPDPFPTVIKAWHQDKAREELIKRLAQHGINGRG